jgi:hypothetical protein
MYKNAMGTDARCYIVGYDSFGMIMIFHSLGWLIEENQKANEHTVVWLSPPNPKSRYWWTMEGEILKIFEATMVPNDARFPHVCPKCKGPAYKGFSSFECKAKCGKENS